MSRREARGPGPAYTSASADAGPQSRVELAVRIGSLAARLQPASSIACSQARLGSRRPECRGVSMDRINNAARICRQESQSRGHVVDAIGERNELAEVIRVCNRRSPAHTGSGDVAECGFSGTQARRRGTNHEGTISRVSVALSRMGQPDRAVAHHPPVGVGHLPEASFA